MEAARYNVALAITGAKTGSSEKKLCQELRFRDSNEHDVIGKETWNKRNTI